MGVPFRLMGEAMFGGGAVPLGAVLSLLLLRL